MLRWKKLGLLFDPSVHDATGWMHEYAQCPVPLLADDRTIRVLFACRPRRPEGQPPVSCPAYVDLARDNLRRVVQVAPAPILPLGEIGCFDEFGVTPTSAVHFDDKLYIYYTGWTRMQSVPYAMAIGLAVSRDGGRTLERFDRGPVLGPVANEPYLQSGAVAHRIGEAWHLWYLTGRRWLLHEGKPEAVYQIAHATSADGLSWQRDGRSVIAPRSEHECQVSFALFHRGGRWHAVFSYRQPTAFRVDQSRAYRLGYATSTDLVTWRRDDGALGIDVSQDGWDSEMMCYPQVLEIDQKVFLFYCGNEFGRKGFGVAELQE